MKMGSLWCGGQFSGIINYNNRGVKMKKAIDFIKFWWFMELYSLLVIAVMVLGIVTNI
jgi:hypothetical protein